MDIENNFQNSHETIPSQSLGVRTTGGVFVPRGNQTPYTRPPSHLPSWVFKLSATATTAFARGYMKNNQGRLQTNHDDIILLVGPPASAPPSPAACQGAQAAKRFVDEPTRIYVSMLSRPWILQVLAGVPNPGLMPPLERLNDGAFLLEGNKSTRARVILTMVHMPRLKIKKTYH